MRAWQCGQEREEESEGHQLQVARGCKIWEGAACCLPEIGIITKNIFCFFTSQLVVQLPNASYIVQNNPVRIRNIVHSERLALRDSFLVGNWVGGVGKRDGNWAGGDRKRETEK
jgi:hypothetical protein